MESIYHIVAIRVNETSWAHVWRLRSRYLRTGYDSDLDLTTVVEPLNVVWMNVSMCRQANLCHKISTHKIVAATSVDDGTNVAIFDDEENPELVMSLKLLGLIHVSTQDTLHDIGVGVVLVYLLAPKDSFIIIVVR
jgi:hypothetical protein